MGITNYLPLLWSCTVPLILYSKIICLNFYIISEHYESGPFNVTIPAGEISVPFNISIIDNNIFEANESFSLSISSSFPPCQELLPSECNVTVTIVDNDGELLHYEYIMLVYIILNLIVITVRFDNAAYTVNEDDGIVQTLLVLSNPSSFVETVQVVDTHITADGMILYLLVVIGFDKSLLEHRKPQYLDFITTNNSSC